MIRKWRTCWRRPFVLPGGDSPWLTSRCAHAGILGVRPWSPTATVISTVQRITAATRPSPGTGCTWHQSGGKTCGPASSFESRFAESAPGAESGHRPRKWTTSNRTAETGQCSQTAAISRAFAILAIAARRWPKCGKSEAFCVPAGGDDQRNAWAHGRDGRTGAVLPCTPPPGPEKFGRSGVRPQAALHARNFPHRDFRGFLACPSRTRDSESEGVYGSAGMWPAGRPEVLPLIPRLVLQGVPAVGILRPGLIHGGQTTAHGALGGQRAKTSDRGGS